VATLRRKKEECAMHLELNEAQLEALRAALAVYLPELDFELARTEDRELQHLLHLRFQRLEEVRRSIEHVRAGEETFA
jgi:hypothetical protein